MSLSLPHKSGYYPAIEAWTNQVAAHCVCRERCRSHWEHLKKIVNYLNCILFIYYRHPQGWCGLFYLPKINWLML